ncbi:transcription elongation factor A N-terminal and central domain-containing protein [Ambystoma mexicanum]|uniref:transcription elongation factor A N-terminal and central domain-containing protein n=1 Tax=Ambystoma mexicanum TaxID=8296 RepID=UPI0037E802A7
MTDEKQIIAIVHHIEKLLAGNNYDDVGDHLAVLEDMDMTVELLQATEAVTTVYRVLKCFPAKNLKKKARLVLSKWKALFKNNYRTSKHNQDGFSVTMVDSQKSNLFAERQVETFLEPSVSEVFYLANVSQSVTVPKEVVNNAMDSHINAAQGDNPAVHSGLFTHDLNPQGKEHQLLVLRTKCTELLHQALAGSTACQGKEHEATFVLAKEIEQHIFLAHASNEKKYKVCIRSKVSNLKNPKHPHLSQCLFSGTLSPKEFVQMTALEMASDERKRLRALYTESAVLEHQLPQSTEGTPTNKLKCRQCENFNCTVKAIPRGTLFLPGWVQNGKPDDDLMTFVICNVCGEKWYNNGWVCL